MRTTLLLPFTLATSLIACKSGNKEISKLRDEVCACKDVACAEKANEKFEEAFGKLKEPSSEKEAEELIKIMGEASQCVLKLQSSAVKPPQAPTAEPTPAAKEPPAEPVAKPAEVKLVETDLSALGKPFVGYVADLPEGAKIEFDDPSRQISWGESEYIALSEAEFWDDGVKSLKTDKDNSNIAATGDVVRWERNPPLGKSWLIDVKLKLGKTTWSCNNGMTGTFSNKENAELAVTMCKSVRKKK